MAQQHLLQDFDNHQTPTWCPGCGNFGIWVALKNALRELHLAPHDVVVVFGIGCSGNQSNFVRAYGFHGLHGRALPVAEGIALANHGLTTIVVSGDGDAYGEGMAHFIHTMRANPNITYLVHDNQVYGLTKGQTSPTSMAGFISPSTPSGAPDTPVNPLTLALAANCSFIARGFAGDAAQLQSLIVAGVRHPGFALIDVLQPCVTFNHLNTYSWFYQRVKPLRPEHRADDLSSAWQAANRGPDELPTGIFFRQPRPTLREHYPVLTAGPLVHQPSHQRDLRDLLALFA